MRNLFKTWINFIIVIKDKMAYQKGYHSMYLIDTNLYNELMTAKNLSSNLSNNRQNNSVSETKETESKTKIIKFDNGVKETLISQPINGNYDIEIDPSKIPPPKTSFEFATNNHDSPVETSLSEFGNKDDLNSQFKQVGETQYQEQPQPANTMVTDGALNENRQIMETDVGVHSGMRNYDQNKVLSDENRSIIEANVPSSENRSIMEADVVNISSGMRDRDQNKLIDVSLTKPENQDVSSSRKKSDNVEINRVGKPTLRIKDKEETKQKKKSKAKESKRREKREKLFNKNRTLSEENKIIDNELDNKLSITNKVKNKYRNIGRIRREKKVNLKQLPGQNVSNENQLNISPKKVNTVSKNMANKIKNKYKKLIMGQKEKKSLQERVIKKIINKQKLAGEKKFQADEKNFKVKIPETYELIEDIDPRSKRPRYLKKPLQYVKKKSDLKKQSDYHLY